MNTKQNINYFKKTDNLQLFGGGLLVVAIFLLWIAGAVHMPIFYVAAPPAIVAGFVLFLIGSSGRSSESDIDAQIRRGTEELELDFSDDIHYSKRVVKTNEPTYIEGYIFDESVMIKKAKNSSLRSSKYTKALIYLMKDRLYINQKTVDLVAGKVDKNVTEILFDDISSISLEEKKERIIFNKKTFFPKSTLLTVIYKDATYTCPIFDNMDSIHYVEKLNKSLGEYKNTKA